MLLLQYLLLGIPVVVVRSFLALYWVHLLPHFRSKLNWSPQGVVLMIVTWPLEVVAIAIILAAIALLHMRGGPSQVHPEALKWIRPE